MRFSNTTYYTYWEIQI